MKVQIQIFISLLFINLVKSACVSAWGQCGGVNYNGEKCCVGGYYCNKLNEWYSQCVPGNASNSSAAPTKTTTTVAKTTTKQPPVVEPTSSGSSNLPATIFIAGDSTADNKGGTNDGKTLGWGKFLGDYFRCNVNNHAKAGRSSRTFWREGRWDTLMSQVKKNDYVIIQFGHNDGGGPTYKNERGVANGTGDETVTVTRSNGEKEVVHTFPWYIRQMAKQVIAKGAHPILLSQTPIFSFQNNKVPVQGRFCDYMKLVANEMKIPFIDHYNLIARQWEKLGENYIKTNNWFPTDHTHTSPTAADFNAQMFVNGIKCNNISDLVNSLNTKGKNVKYSCSV